MSGGSIDSRIWNPPPGSVTWIERIQWCKDTAEVWLNQSIRIAHICGQGMAFVHRLGFAHRYTALFWQLLWQQLYDGLFMQGSEITECGELVLAMLCRRV